MARFILLILVLGLMTIPVNARQLESQAPTPHSAIPTDPTPLNITRVGRYNPGPYRSDDPRAAEIVQFDPLSKRMVIINSFLSALQIVDITQPATPTLVISLPISPTANNVPNSVDVHNGVVVVAANAAVKTNPGRVLFLDTNGNQLNEVTVGALPDMVTFTPDGKYVLVAGEGEPNSYNQVDSVDPEGTVTIIAMPSAGVQTITTSTILTPTLVRFDAFNAGGPRHGELDPAIRITGPNASVAQDLEPEYIAVAPDSRTAYVTLQENNALATIDIPQAQVVSLKSLGFKNYASTGNRLDPSDLDGANQINHWPIFGMYQPDTIAAYSANNQLYLVTANEGDARDYTGFKEEVRVKNMPLDSAVFTNSATLKLDANLGRLNVTNATGDVDRDGDFDQIYAYGGRSFSIWNAATGTLIMDSGDDLEQRTAATFPNNFNANATSDSRDNRSDDKGPEPEALALGTVEGRTFAFVGLERMGGLMVYDVTNPQNPSFIKYETARTFPGSYVTGTPDDLAPEGITFIPGHESPSGSPMLLVANEASGSVSLYELRLAPTISSAVPMTGTYGNSYSHQFITTGTPSPTLSLQGTLPPGLQFNPSTGIISGTPTQSGVYPNLMLTAANHAQPNATQAFTLVINQAPLTITARSATRQVGQPNPTFQADYTGFLFDDSADDLTAAVEFTTTATINSPIGQYPIVSSAATAPNYAITFVNGTLTITKHALYAPMLRK